MADGGFSGRTARGTRTSEIEAEIRREIQNERGRYLGEGGGTRGVGWEGGEKGRNEEGAKDGDM